MSRLRLAIPGLICVLLGSPLWAAQPQLDALHPAAGSAATGQPPAANGACEKGVSLYLHNRSLIGWIGTAPLQLVRRDNQFFGVFQKRQVVLQVSEDAEGGTWLRGKVGDVNVRWRVRGERVLAEFPRCPNF